MKIAIIGATGLVGGKMIQVLKEQKLRLDEIIFAASEKSVGKKILFQDKELTVISVEEAIEKKPDIAIFSAGAEASLKYAPLFAANGTYVIDNSSAWRKDPDIPLVVPEINAADININNHIIQTFCSTNEQHNTLGRGIAENKKWRTVYFNTIIHHQTITLKTTIQ